MDSCGKVVIAPAFLDAGYFSEGLAEARVNRKYGYIDATGQFVIAPQFDVATPFSEGLAGVKKNGICFYINRKGERVFESVYEELSPFIHGRMSVRTTSRKAGVIDQQGRLIVDTVFQSIGPFVNGYAAVTGLNDNAYPRAGETACYEEGIIDTTGHFLVPYGVYDLIDNQANGYFGVAMPADTSDMSRRTGFLNDKGKLVLVADKKLIRYFLGSVGDGLVRAVLYNDRVKEDVAFVDMSGKVIIHDPVWRNVLGFSGRRSFAHNGKKLIMMDVSGKQVTDKQFDWAVDYYFKGGVARVVYDGKWGLVDTNAHFLIPPIYSYLSPVGEGVYAFSVTDKERDAPGGIVGKTGSVILYAALGQSMFFSQGLLSCKMKNRLTYFNRNGKMVWQEKKDTLMDVPVR